MQTLSKSRGITRRTRRHKRAVFLYTETSNDSATVAEKGNAHVSAGDKTARRHASKRTDTCSRGWLYVYDLISFDSSAKTTPACAVVISLQDAPRVSPYERLENRRVECRLSRHELRAAPSPTSAVDRNRSSEASACCWRWHGRILTGVRDELREMNSFSRLAVAATLSSSRPCSPSTRLRD